MKYSLVFTLGVVVHHESRINRGLTFSPSSSPHTSVGADTEVLQTVSCEIGGYSIESRHVLYSSSGNSTF